ncbi:MAG: DEAD/DEAH box helicase [Natronomonas sp.]
MTAHDRSNPDPGHGPIDGRSLVESFPRVGLTPDSENISVLELPATEADRRPAASVLRPELAAAYPFDLYSHQATALSALEAGDNVTVSTPTASGKTHVYALRIAENLLDAGVVAADGTRETTGNDASTALCLYPTKALTRDQHEAMESLYEELELDVRVRIYDGDTPRSERREIRETADVILSNFQGLNVYLEHHDAWSRFYSALSLVVVDESHTYTGIEGMHAAWILRRMKRIASYWGGDPSYVCTSATIGNPREHSRDLLGESVTVVDDDGSPRGPRDLVFWNPPPVDREPSRPTSAEGDTAIDADDADDSADSITNRVPATVEAPRVFDHLLSSDVQTLLFCPSRKLTELAPKRATQHRRSNAAAGDRSVGSISAEPYHAGLGRRTRHAREAEFKSDALRGLATTSALELGIDVGDIDATVLMGYPGQRQSFWQRVGRAGRETDRSLAVLVAQHRTLDQYVFESPEYLLEADVEDAVVDTNNDSVFATHLLAAADEVALDSTDCGSFAAGKRLKAGVEMWRRAGRLDGHLDAAVSYVGPSRPQTDISLYGTDETNFQLRVTDDNSAAATDVDLEPVGRNRAFRDYHEGAIRLHDGQAYEVLRLEADRPQPIVELQPVDGEYYTRTRTEVTVVDAESEATRSINGFELHRGRGTVFVHHHSYDRLSIATGETEEAMIPTDTPPIQIDTELCWLEVPDDVEAALIRRYADYGTETGVDAAESDAIGPHLGYVAGLHAAEHATIQTAPLELRVEKGDLGGLSTLVLNSHYARPEQEPLKEAVGESIEAAEAALRQRRATLDDRPKSGWFIYDGVDGGLGFARAIYENFEALAERARDQLRDCRCGRPNGCPACTFDENCGNDNAPLLRASAVDVLDHLLGDGDEGELADPDDGGERRPALFYS